MAQKSVDLLRIENVSKKFEGRTVLNNVSATLSTGKILGLIGKSAAGKSVLIHMIRGTQEYLRFSIFSRVCLSVSDSYM